MDTPTPADSGTSGTKWLPFSEWKAQQQAQGKWLSDADYAKKPTAPAKPFSGQFAKPFSR